MHAFESKEKLLQLVKADAKGSLRGYKIAHIFFYPWKIAPYFKLRKRTLHNPYPSKSWWCQFGQNPSLVTNSFQHLLTRIGSENVYSFTANIFLQMPYLRPRSLRYSEIFPFMLVLKLFQSFSFKNNNDSR